MGGRGRGTARQVSQTEYRLPSPPTNLKQLKGPENWAAWKMWIVAYLQTIGMFNYLTTRTSDAEMADKDSVTCREDSHVQLCLIGGLDDNLMEILASCNKRAFDMWKALCSNFENQGVQRRLTLIYKFLDTKRANCKSLTDYVTQVAAIYDQLKNSPPVAVSDETAAAVVLRNLRPEDIIIKRFTEESCQEMVDGESVLKYKLVIERLRSEGHDEKAMQDTQSSGTALMAFQGSRPFHQRGRGSGRRGRGGRGGHGGRGGYHHQHQDGYQNRDGSGYKFKVFPVCRWCGRTNHPEEICRYQQNGLKRKDDQQKGNQSRGSKQSRGSSDLRGSRGSVFPFGPSSFALKGAALGDDKGQGAALMAKRSAASTLQSSFQLVCKTSHMAGDIQFYIDSGASDHMCGDISTLFNYKNSEVRIPIECAGNQILYIEGHGDLLTNDGKHNGLTGISNVKFVPSLSSNLLSVSQLTKTGHAVLFVENRCGLYNASDIASLDKPLLETFESNGTYKLNLEVRTQQHSALKTSQINTEPWHERLGHLGKNNMGIISSLVDGMSKVTEVSGKCNTCQRAKRTKGPFPKGGARRASAVLEIIHSDVCEVTDGHSLQGFRYFVTFIDDLTRYTYIGLLKNKSNVFDKFCQYKALVERHTGKSIKHLRSDNGGEYVNEKFKQYFIKEGMLNQHSVARNPQQNGVSERANRTLLEKMRALLKGAGLDIKFWPLALQTAVFLKNISPTKAVPNQVPYEKWTGSRPDVSILKVFGCLAFAHVDSGKKLTDRTKEYIFVGYDDERRAYKLMDPKNNAVTSHRYRDVIFDENVFPALCKNQVERPASTPVVIPAVVVPVVKPGLVMSGNQTNASNVLNLNSKLHTDSESDSDSEHEGENQRKGDSLYGYYTDTSLSGMFHDGASTSRSETSTPTGPGSSGTISVDVEGIDSEQEEQTNNQAVSRKRCIVPPKHFDGFVLYGFGGANDPNVYRESTERSAWFASHAMSTLPETVQQAMASPESQLWLSAMQDELCSFEKNNVWTMQAAPEGVKIVGNKWVFKRKTNVDGTVLHRARLVAKGYTQTYGVDYFDTFAPVVRRESLRILFSVAANFNLKIAHLDVKTAFLHGDLEEEVYMAQPDGFLIAGSEHLVCKLQKAVYGLKQAARSWNLKADKLLKEEGFVNTEDESCIYIRSNETVTIVALYVDDFYLFYRDDEEKSAILRALNAVVEVKDLGDAKNCLGMRIERDWNKGTIRLHQEEYTKSILKRFNMENCDGKSVPLEFKLKLHDYEMGYPVKAPYQQLIGSLLYLSTNTRPDISYAVSFLSQFNSCYTSTHWNLAKRMLNYLKQTSKLGLLYKRCDNPSFSLVGHADADWAGNPGDYRSYTGFCFTLDKNLICWESRKQSCTAQSTTESESIALREAVLESIFLNRLVDSLFGCGLQQIPMFCDNEAAINLSKSDNYFKARTKHYGTKIQVIRDCLRRKGMTLDHISSKDNPADIFTKALERVNHEKCCKFLSLSSE